MTQNVPSDASRRLLDVFASLCGTAQREFKETEGGSVSGRRCRQPASFLLSRVASLSSVPLDGRSATTWLRPASFAA